ncbi:MAG: hypothetical protein WDZ91_02185 [Paenibacillaceae bacterium]
MGTAVALAARGTIATRDDTISNVAIIRDKSLIILVVFFLRSFINFTISSYSYR